MTLGLGLDSEWVCEMQWPEGQTQGGPGVLVIRPAAEGTYPAGGISQTLLRDIDFKAALNTLRQQQAGGKRWTQMRERNQAKMNALLVSYGSDGAITDEYLALLSRAYVAAVSMGQDKPLDYLAELTGKSFSAIQSHLWKATRKGLLERSPGRVGGKVTGKAANILSGLV